MVSATGFGAAETAVATVGAVLTTVTVAVPLIEPMVALTVSGGVTAGAVYNPPAVMLPETALQLKVGWTLNALPNWSMPVAVNCCVPFGA